MSAGMPCARAALAMPWNTSSKSCNSEIECRTQRVDQVELELRRHHRRQPDLRKTFQHIGQHLPRIAVKPFAVRIAHAEQNLRRRPVQPVDA